jgi:hypothetical protein
VLGWLNLRFACHRVQDDLARAQASDDEKDGEGENDCSDSKSDDSFGVVASEEESAERPSKKQKLRNGRVATAEEHQPQRSPESSNKSTPVKAAQGKSKSRPEKSPESKSGPGKIQKGRQSSNPELSDSTPTAKAKAAAAAKAGVGRVSKQAQEKIGKSISSCEKTLQRLTEISASALWRSILRAAEVDGRMQKGHAAEQELKLLETSGMHMVPEQASQVQELQKQLREELGRVEALALCCRQVRQSSSQELSEDVAAYGPTCKMLEQLATTLVVNDSVTLVDMVQVVAKKLQQKASWRGFHY